MKQLNKGNTIHIKTLKLSHKTLTETKKNKFSQKKTLHKSTSSSSSSSSSSSDKSLLNQAGN
jgi:hypothetical protein